MTFKQYDVYIFASEKYGTLYVGVFTRKKNKEMATKLENQFN